jgi:hypothetical protein
MNFYPAMLMKTRGLSERKRELLWPALKIKSLKSKQLPGLGCDRGALTQKDVKNEGRSG